MMCRTPGKVWKGQTGAISCDHYHRWKEDVGLMKDIGLMAYRFSVSWPRVMPAGKGAVNRKGLSFYDRLVDGLLDAGIQPWVTLFHWDYPYELYTRGGWLSPESPEWFADYARVVVDKLSDRVSHWMTLNEPACFIGLGLQTGSHAPGMVMDFPEVLRAVHHTLIAHGKAVQVIRANSRLKPVVGLAPCGRVTAPASETKADIEAARRHMYDAFGRDVFNYALWMDPILFGEYPAKALETYGAAMPRVKSSELKTIAQPVDFYGMNIYVCDIVRAGPGGEPVTVDYPAGYGMTTMEWGVVPQALYWGPRFAWERGGKPIVVTENGMSNVDWIAADGQVHDPQRIDFVARYLAEYRRAIGDGVKALGYFQWTLMDNFEWAFGFKRRFGLIYVDYPTGRRVPKDSARWYRSVIETNGECIP